MPGTKALALLVAALALLPPPADAASRGGSFRLWRHGARELAMGDASTLGAGGLEALFSQPASLAGIDRWAAGAALAEPQDGLDLSLSSFALGAGTGHRAALPADRCLLSQAAAALAFQQLGATLADGSDWSEWTAAAGLAWSPRRWLAVGARGALSGGGSEAGPEGGRARSLALGARAAVFHPALELGWFAEDVHHRYRSDNGSEQRRQAAQHLAFGVHLPARIDLELLGRHEREAWARWALGVEWEPWTQSLWLRGGLIRHGGEESRWVPSAGVGLGWRTLRVDYGYRHDADEGPGSWHRFSLQWSSGSARGNRER